MSGRARPLGFSLTGASEVPQAVVDLVDGDAGPPRRTDSLLAALLARAATLNVISGAQAMASISAGLAAIGRAASDTVEGRRVRAALDQGRPADNLRLLFDELGFGALASLSPPTQLLEDFTNDLALLLAPDLADAVGRARAGVLSDPGTGPLRPPEAVDPVDFVVGLWLFSRHVVGAIDALADWLRPPDAATAAPAEPPEPGEGRILR